MNYLVTLLKSDIAFGRKMLIQPTSYFSVKVVLKKFFFKGQVFRV